MSTTKRDVVSTMIRGLDAVEVFVIVKWIEG